MDIRPNKINNPGIIRKTLMKTPLIKKMFTSLSINSAHLSGSLKKTVASLGYSEHTANDFIDEVMGWEDAAGAPLMIGWKGILDKARGEHKSGKLSVADMVNIETKIVTELGNKIGSEFSYNEKVFDLAQALTFRQAMCDIYTEMVYAAASALELPVKGVSVTKMYISSSPNERHSISMIRTADNRNILIDLTSTPLTITNPPFRLEDKYNKEGKYLVRKPDIRVKDDGVGIYTRIQILEDANGLTAVRHYNHGVINSRAGQKTQAIEFFDKAISLDREFADAYYNRGTTYLEIEQFEKALADLEKVIVFDPHDYNSYCNCGLANLKLGRYDRAIARYTMAMGIEPDNATTYFARGNVYRASGQNGRAIADYTKAIDLDRKYFEAYYNRGALNINQGQINNKIGQIRSGVIDLKEAGKLDPKFRPGIEALINELKAAGWLNG